MYVATIINKESRAVYGRVWGEEREDTKDVIMLSSQKVNE